MLDNKDGTVVHPANHYIFWMGVYGYFIYWHYKITVVLYFMQKQDGIFVVEVHLVCQHLHERYNYLEYLSFIL